MMDLANKLGVTKEVLKVMEQTYADYPNIGRRSLAGAVYSISGKMVTEYVTRKFLKLVKEGITTNLTRNEDSIRAIEGNSTNRPIKVNELLALYDIDLEVYKVERFVANSWDVTNRKGQTFTNYQTKIWLTRIKPVVDLKVILADFRENAKRYAPKYKKVDYSPLNEKGNLLEITLFDLHLGKLSVADECLENYNIAKARRRFLGAIDTLLRRASSFDIEKILFPIGNDFFNIDNLQGTTTKGTAQVEEKRWQQSYTIGRKLLVEAIDTLKQVAPVDVLVIPGNHDFERMYYVGDALDLWYSKCKDVTVDNRATPRKYYKYGKCLIGFTHGNEEKMTNLPLIMSHEASNYWSEVKFKEFHLGHFHHNKEVSYRSSLESIGIIVRNLKSLSGADEWSHRRGFVGQIKGGEAFIWSKENGLLARLEANLNY